jgi:hypothetical protein
MTSHTEQSTVIIQTVSEKSEAVAVRWMVLAILSYARNANYRRLVRLMVKTMSRLCPLLIIGASGANPHGGMDCLEIECQMWCKEELGNNYAVINPPATYIKYRAGCGLMPKANRRGP